jgi:muramidase (phage lysozyme)
MSKQGRIIFIVTGTIIIILILIAIYQRYVSKGALNNPNVQAFLKTIRYAEGTSGPDGYRTMFTGKLFDSYDAHPNINNCSGALCSTAAGAYQFLYSTWLELKLKLALPDFSPNSQDLAAVEKIRERGALNDVIAGEFATAVSKLNREWASLPGSPYGQPTRTLAQLQSVYQNEGGSYA